MNPALWQRYTTALDSGALDSSDRAAQLGALLSELGAQPDSAEAHHLRGLILADLGRSDEALEAQGRALELDEGLAAAHYSLGLLFAARGDDDAAMRHWSRTTELEPGHADALYNLGQVQYNRGDFAAALKAWQRVRALAPEDFETLKKIVQAQRALGQWDDANSSMAALFTLWQRSPDPAVRELFEVTVDQFSVAGHRVLAAEMLRPRDPDLYYETVFRVLDSARQTIMTVQLESSQYGRDRGVPYLLGINTAAGHQSVGPTFAEKPSYARLKRMAIDLIAARLSTPGTSSPS